jgi:predicted Zn-dependent protease
MKAYSRSLLRLCALLPLFLISCGWFEPKPAPVPEPPPPPPRDVVKEIRAQAAAAGDVLQIQPVQNPRVTVLLTDILDAEAKADFKKARRLLAEAQSIEGNNPLVVQLKAEALLREKKYSDALIWAQRSFDNSAQTGPLCVRNWLTIAEVHLAKKSTALETAARTRAAQCPHRAIERL